MIRAATAPPPADARWRDVGDGKVQIGDRGHQDQREHAPGPRAGRGGPASAAPDPARMVVSDTGRSIVVALPA